MNRRRFIKTALGAMTAFLFASWRSSDEPPTDMPFVPKLGQVDRSRELIPTDVFADGLAATFNYPTSVLRIDRLKSGAEYRYYVNPEEVRYKGWIDHPDSTTFVRMDGSTVTVNS